MKKFLTIFYYSDIGPQHLYKDVGGIPLALSKYQGWNSDFAYVKFNGEIHNLEYEKYVHLLPINKEGRPYLLVLKFLWKNAKKYDVVNMYHFNKTTLLACAIAKIRNPKVKFYLKCDMGRDTITALLKKNNLVRKVGTALLYKMNLFPDIFTVETKKYVDILNQYVKGRMKYLPNGFWGDAPGEETKNIYKEKIILNVGRLEAYQKNIELLIEAFAKIPSKIRNDWKLVLIGSHDRVIDDVARKVIQYDPSLDGKIIFVGKIDDKILLNRYYKRAAIYALTSRTESFGISLLEALHQADFPIVTDCCDAFYDMLNEGKIGCIVPNKDTGKYSNALISAMQNYNHILNEGRQNKAYVDQKFDYKIIAKNLNRYLKNTN